MNKTQICIELLQLLNTRQIISRNELAELLETNPRNIIEYIRTLEECGFEIESARGVYGGYRLKNTKLLPMVRLTDLEVQVLKSSCDYLAKQQDFLAYKDYALAIGKVISTAKNDVESEVLTVIDRYPLKMPKDELLKRYDLFKEAINFHFKCEIEYQSGNNRLNIHIIHPYKTFIYSDAWFVLAWNETVNNYGYFRLNRILKLKVLHKVFQPLLTYKERDFLDEFGMKQNGAYYHIIIDFLDLYTVLSERIYGKNQVLTRLDERTTRLECDMQNKEMIKTFVLGYGSKARVIEPQWLKKEIVKEAKKMIENQSL